MGKAGQRVRGKSAAVIYALKYPLVVFPTLLWCQMVAHLSMPSCAMVPLCHATPTGRKATPTGKEEEEGKNCSKMCVRFSSTMLVSRPDRYFRGHPTPNLVLIAEDGLPSPRVGTVPQPAVARRTPPGGRVGRSRRSRHAPSVPGKGKRKRPGRCTSLTAYLPTRRYKPTALCASPFGSAAVSDGNGGGIQLLWLGGQKEGIRQWWA